MHRWIVHNMIYNMHLENNYGDFFIFISYFKDDISSMILDTVLTLFWFITCLALAAPWPFWGGFRLRLIISTGPSNLEWEK